MKISSLQENLKNGLSIVGHIAGKNINLPILSNVLIEAKDGKIKLVTTDLEIGITCFVRGKIEQEGVVTVDSKIAFDCVSLLPQKTVNFEQKNNELVIQADNYKTTIKGQSAEDFPLIPQGVSDDYFEVDMEEFKKALTQVIFSVSTSETRIELTGVLFDFNKNELIMAATDSYRLAERKIKVKSKNEDGKKIIVPAKTLQEVIRILSIIKNEEIDNKNIRFYISDAQILFKMGSVELVSRLIEGQYPDYKQIIPTQSETKSVLGRSELIRAVKVAAIFTKTGVNDVNLDFLLEKKAIIVSSVSTQTGDNITELTSEIEGKDNGVVVNCKYLLDGLNNINSEMVEIEVTNSNTPCVLKPGGSSDYLYLIMPIRQ